MTLRQKNKEENKERVLEWLCMSAPPKDHEVLYMNDGCVLIRTPDMTDEQWGEIRHQHMLKHGDF